MVASTFKAGMQRCFVSVGLGKQVDGTFVKYSEHRKGKIHILPNSTHELADKTSLAEVASEIIIESRADMEADGMVPEDDGPSDEDDDMDTTD